MALVKHVQAKETLQGRVSPVVLGQTPRKRILSALGSKDCAPTGDSKGEEENIRRQQARRRLLATTTDNIDRLTNEIKAIEQQRLQTLQLFMVFYNVIHGSGDSKDIPKIAGCDADANEQHRVITGLLGRNSDLVGKIKSQTGPGSVLASILDATVRE